MSERPGLAELRAEVGRYYSQKVGAHGATPQGVDWSCLPTQEMRFVQLLKLCDFTLPSSLNDVGCGYGALLSFLGKRYRGATVDYLGIDVSPAMIEQATRGWRRRRRGRFAVGHTPSRAADYCVASGIFNVKLSHSTHAWEAFVETTMQDMYSKSRVGFAVNFVDSAAVADCAPEIYATTPERWLPWCADRFDAQAQVVRGYGMREFTLLVRQTPARSSLTI